MLWTFQSCSGQECISLGSENWSRVGRKPSRWTPPCALTLLCLFPPDVWALIHLPKHERLRVAPFTSPSSCSQWVSFFLVGKHTVKGLVSHLCRLYLSTWPPWVRSLNWAVVFLFVNRITLYLLHGVLVKIKWINLCKVIRRVPSTLQILN